MYVNLLELEFSNDIMEYSFAQKSTFMTINLHIIIIHAMDNIYITDKSKLQTYLFGPPAIFFLKNIEYDIIYFDIFMCTKI